ncbi:MAG TPA: ribosome assembly cofactor RimP [Porphyromonadaceae bacterium]|nr:ribosome assembly cofactor RimP [Porphyromonadaceae bacterium]
MISKEDVQNWAEEFLSGKESYLVEVRVEKDNLIEIEIDNFKGVDVDECASLSRYIEEHLNRDIEDFSLEVGSVGLTSPFKIRRQYEKNIGNEIELLTQDGRKLSGILIEVKENEFVLSVKERVKIEGKKKKEEVEKKLLFRYEDIKQARCKLKV